MDILQTIIQPVSEQTVNLTLMVLLLLAIIIFYIEKTKASTKTFRKWTQQNPNKTLLYTTAILIILISLAMGYKTETNQNQTIKSIKCVYNEISETISYNSTKIIEYQNQKMITRQPNNYTNQC